MFFAHCTIITDNTPQNPFLHTFKKFKRPCYIIKSLGNIKCSQFRVLCVYLWPPTKTIKKDYFSTLQKTICVLLQGGKEWTTCTYYWKLFALKENLVQILLLMDCGKKCCVKNRGIIRGDILLGTQESIYLILWQDDLLYSFLHSIHAWPHRDLKIKPDTPIW